MKAFLSLLLTAAITLGHFLATAQDDEYGYWENGVSGEWVDALHAGPGYSGPVDEDQAPPYPQEELFAYEEEHYPQLLNFDEVYQKISLAHARNPEGIHGIYEFKVLVNPQGKVTKCSGKQADLFPFVRQLNFEENHQTAWIKVVFDFGQIQ